MMSRAQRLSVSLDGDPRGSSCTPALLPTLLLASLFFASSAAVISCPPDGEGACSPIGSLRSALNKSSFATCSNASAPPAATPPLSQHAERVKLSDADENSTTTTAGGASGAKGEESTLPPASTEAPPKVDPSLAAAAAAAEAAAQPPQIATFDEWTKQKKQQMPPPVVLQPPLAATATPDAAASAAHGGAPLPQQLQQPRVVAPAEVAATATRNYASRECGAKVIYANPEAENTKAVLNDKEKDDYMRNPCDKAQHKHVVIELCETIQPRSIEIANFELFSSGPAAVRFSAAERFPSQQWSVLGEWAVADTRTVQTLPVPADKLTYAKFIKMELLAHHGSEHFCTLSTVRVLGLSMVDEYEAEAANAAARAAAPLVPHAAVPVAATEAPVVTATLTEQQQQQQAVKKDDQPSTTAASTPTEPTVTTTTEVPPIAVVEAPPVTPRAPTNDSPAPAPSGIVQDVMSGTLLKKIIEVVIRADASQPRRPRDSAYAACDRTPVSGWPRDTCPRRNFFFCPRVAETSPVRGPTTAQTAARRMHARRVLVALTQRLEEEERARAAAAAAAAAQLPVTQIDAPPQRKGTAPVVEQQPTAAPKEEAEPPAAQPKQQQPPVATPPPTQEPPRIFDGLAGGSGKTENAMLRMNKRITVLEVNLTLTNEYLNELSQQYVSFTDQQTRAMAVTRAAAEAAATNIGRTVNETVRDELFNLRKEVDALSAWLATLRAQAGGVALTTPRRLSGSGSASSTDTTAAPERSPSPSSAEVGHRRPRHRNQMDFNDEEDYVSYDEDYEQETCPYRKKKGRAYGPQPRPARAASDADEEEDGEQADDFDLRHFRHHSDGIWTTEQVLYAVLGAQALTVLLVLGMQFCYARFFGRRRPTQQQAAAPHPPAPLVDPAELERLIAAALERRAEREREAAREPPPLDPADATIGASPARSTASSVTSSELPSSAAAAAQQHGSNKKRRRQQRRNTEHQSSPPAAAHQHHHHQCRQCGEGQNLDWDSAMDSSLPSPSQTASEEEFEARLPGSGSPPIVAPGPGSAPSSPPSQGDVTATTPKR